MKHSFLSILFPLSIAAISFGAEFASDRSLPLGAQQAKLLEPRSKEFTRLPVNWTVNARDKQNAQKAWEMITEANKSYPTSHRKLHVVYVTFQDRPFLPMYKERYDNVLKNIQVYYADQMKANGFPPLTFPLDLDANGKLIIHTGHVDQPMSQMTVHSSGVISRKVAKEVLAKKGINADENHILVICQLEDGIGPYYGGGSVRSGTGWTCDQANLDPRNFLSTKYFGGRFNTSIGVNATIYIGGTAHELGHSFSLPHTCQGWDYPDSGTSLMGSGNHTYGNELRNEGKGSFLVPSDALMLASVPLFNGVDSVNMHGSDGLVYSDITFTPVPNGAIIKGKLTTIVPCYGVVIFLNPPGNSDYNASAVSVVPNKDGTFEAEIRRPDYSGDLEIKMTALLTDGTKKTISATAKISKDGLTSPELYEKIIFSKVSELWAKYNTSKAQEAFAEVIAQHGDNPEFKEIISVWEKVFAPHAATSKETPANMPAEVKSVSLVDSQYSEAKSGWRYPSWDMLYPSDLGPRAYFTNYGYVKRFVLIHANGVLKYQLGGKWTHFTARLGLPSGKDGSIIFTILLDGKEVAKTKTLENGQFDVVDLNVTGAGILEIQVNDAGNGSGGDWGIIGEPTITR